MAALTSATTLATTDQLHHYAGLHSQSPSAIESTARHRHDPQLGGARREAISAQS
ncbi:hypothetical protein HQQ80_01630 [Microbacteriaceae bacterium VKM Ac-2855]|nr:hypothetical protein [Microbacteriaceae bacterium VKM Ac-2855]